MKVLSLHQPWATLLVTGFKRCETRSWWTAHRGPLVIHATKKWCGDFCDVARLPSVSAHLSSIGVELPAKGIKPRPHNLPFGAIVGIVMVKEIYPTKRVDDAFLDDGIVRTDRDRLVIPNRERIVGDFGPDRYAWLCENPLVFGDPLPFVGSQGLTEIKDRAVLQWLDRHLVGIYPPAKHEGHRGGLPVCEDCFGETDRDGVCRSKKPVAHK